VYNDPNQRQQVQYGQPQQFQPYGQAANGNFDVQQQQSAYRQVPYGQPQQESPYRQGSYGQPPQQFGQPQYGFQNNFNSAPPNFVSTQQPVKKPRRGMGRILLILGLVMVVIIVAAVVGIFALMNTSTTTPTTASSTTATSSTTTTSSSSVAQTVTSYYSAIKNQDYNTAYTYLDSTNITIQGQKITQSAFTQLAQQLDKAAGKVVAFTIAKTTTVSKNGINMTQVTVSVTRKGITYSVHLTLQQEGGAWKIITLDTI
jgi:hypothetical protein